MNFGADLWLLKAKFEHKKRWKRSLITGRFDLIFEVQLDYPYIYNPLGLTSPLTDVMPVNVESVVDYQKRD